MAVLWSLWRQRNEVIFRSKKLPPWLVANRASKDVKLWQQYCGKRKLNAAVVVVSSNDVTFREIDDAIT